MIHNRLRELAAARATVHQQFATARRIVEQSGASRTTVYGLLHNRVRRLPLRDLELLCRWLDCQPGDLLYIEEEQQHGRESTDDAGTGHRRDHPGDIRTELGS